MILISRRPVVLVMSDTPQFLEFSVPCPDVGKSLAWYRELGFTELLAGDIRTHHYAVITDGDLCIGLHANDYPSAGLCFVQQNLSRRVRQGQAAGTRYEFAHLGEDEFHEAALLDPDGTLAVLLEARTFSGALSSVATPVIGRFSHIALPCTQLPNSIEFWQDFGFIAVTAMELERTELHIPGLAVEMIPGERRITLHFKPDNLNDCVHAIEHDNPVQKNGAGYELIAPEGTRIAMS